MKKLRKTASVLIASALLTSSFAFAFSARAAESADSANVAEVTVEDYALQDNVQDGVILHAFNWSYDSIRENLAAIAAAGYSAVQTSPVQQPKDYSDSKDVAGQWWKLYQPVSMSIAEESWLGTASELAELCDAADEYGIKIICDIVSNHMGNNTEDNPNSISEQLGIYEPDMYSNSSSYFRSNTFSASDSSVQKVVQGHVSSCPDLITESSAVQDKVISLLEECIDCGVDGFRFDAAKHIETEDDGEYASDYWENVTTSAGEYYHSKTGGELYIYGEILNTCGTGRSYGSYTKYINITDNVTGDRVLANVVNGKASSAASSSYSSGEDASSIVLWAESHDTYEGDSGAGGITNTSGVSDEDIVKAWAIVASREDATALYFARPGDSLMGEAAGDTTYKSTAVSEVNKFHNLFVGESETLGSSGDIAYVVRGDSGVVLSNVGGTSAEVSISGTGMADGEYIDTVTGNAFKVSSGVLTGEIGSTGVAVVYDGSTTPANTCSVESGEFSGETLTLTLGLVNADSGTYRIDNSSPVAYTGEITIRVGSDYNYGETINLTLTASDGDRQTSTAYKYVKKASASSGVYVWFNSAILEKSGWSAPYYAYIYDEDSEDTVYKNSDWPGVQMQYDEPSGLYYVEVSSDTALCDGGEASFDLAHSGYTKVIINDGNNQYPASNARTSLNLDGASRLFGAASSSSWEGTALVPSEVEQDATEVTRDGSEPDTTNPTQGTVTEAYLYGDVDLSGDIDINDATQLQYYLAAFTQLSDLALALSDVDANVIVDISDVTCIQRYLAAYNDDNLTGKEYIVETVIPTTAAPTTAVPTTAAPTTAATEAPTEAPTEAEETYTLYFKTMLTWMTADGANLYAYDNDTGISYQLIRDENEYPNVYTAKVPEDMTNVIFYRALSAVDVISSPSDSGPVYNSWAGTLSSVNNCFTLAADETGSCAPYVSEEAPEWSLSTVYYDNSNTKWSKVYLYGWGYSINAEFLEMTQIDGTDIWYLELPEEIPAGTTCFLFVNKNSWEGCSQTADLTVAEGKNMYVYDGAAGAWTTYTEQ